MRFFKDSLTLVDKIQLIVSWIIRVSLAFAIISSAIKGSWLTLFISSLTLFLTFLPAIIERNYKICLPTEFQLILVIFIYTSIFLGQVHNYYTRYWWWDIVLHTSSGLALGFVGFLILFVLYEQDVIRARPIFVAIFSFSFALAMGAVWEIFEFSMDSIFGTFMQRGSLSDTMWDLIVDAAGALVTSIFGYFYLKGGKSRIFRRFLVRFINENPGLFGMKDK